MNKSIVLSVVILLATPTHGAEDFIMGCNFKEEIIEQQGDMISDCYDSGGKLISKDIAISGDFSNQRIVVYAINGAPMMEEVYVKSKLTRRTSFFADGQKQSSCSYENKKPIGTCLQWYESGAIASELTHNTKGEIVKRVLFTEGGVEYFSAEYSQGKPSGKIIEKTCTGELVREGIYRFGILENVVTGASESMSCINSECRKDSDESTCKCIYQYYVGLMDDECRRSFGE